MTLTHVFESGPLRRTIDGLAARSEELGARVRRYRARRRVYLQAMSELQLFTDRELADLCFTRADIPRVARESAERA